MLLLFIIVDNIQSRASSSGIIALFSNNRRACIAKCLTVNGMMLISQFESSLWFRLLPHLLIFFIITFTFIPTSFWQAVIIKFVTTSMRWVLNSSISMLIDSLRLGNASFFGSCLDNASLRKASGVFLQLEWFFWRNFKIVVNSEEFTVIFVFFETGQVFPR